MDWERVKVTDTKYLLLMVKACWEEFGNYTNDVDTNNWLVWDCIVRSQTQKLFALHA